jgi:hypothetical protein
MNKGFIIAFATLIGFAAGTFAGSWMQRTQPVPAPPSGGILSELRDAPLNSVPENPDAPKPSGQPLPDEALRQMKAEIDAFKKKVEPIKLEFRTEKPPAPKLKAGEKPDPAKDWRYRIYDGMDTAITLVVIPFTLARLTEELGLSYAQREAVHQLLIQRREKFLALVDSTPPPSFNLGKLVPQPAETK